VLLLNFQLLTFQLFLLQFVHFQLLFQHLFYLAGGRFVDAVKNKEIVINEEMEAKLLEAEKFFENLEKQKAKELNDARIEKIKPYLENAENMTFSEFSDEDFDDLVFAKKTRFENEQKEREAEALRIETERKIKELYEKRKELLLPYWNFILDADKDRNWGKFDEETFNSCLETYKTRKVEFDKEQEKIRVENARLQKEAEAKEIELQKERAKAKAEADRIEAENNAKLEAQRKENARIAKELQDKKDAEIKAENERLAKIEADKKEAEKLAKAPVKNQLKVWVDNFELPNCGIENETSKSIIEKFESFKNWSINKINNL